MFLWWSEILVDRVWVVTLNEISVGRVPQCQREFGFWKLAFYSFVQLSSIGSTHYRFR